MSILVVSNTYPMPDRQAGDFRLMNLITMIGEARQLFYCVLGEHWQAENIGNQEVERYKQMLSDMGVITLGNDLIQCLREHSFDAVIFEWHFTAKDRLRETRAWQPRALIIIDSVDVTYNRLESKARLSQKASDILLAEETKQQELDVYNKSDVVITVTDEDAAILAKDSATITTYTIPNIHPTRPAIADITKNGKALIFIGSFTHDPNVDAMIYFCNEIFPLVQNAEPDVKLRIIGNQPTSKIKELESENIEVLGYVPELAPYLESSLISIAPLRFGGGMKGKIGEAMSFSLPVVTTSIGIEGFGLEPGKDVLTGDTPEEFAEAVIALLKDEDKLNQIRMAGYNFINDRYSESTTRKRVASLFNNLDKHRAKRTPVILRGLTKLRSLWRQHMGWRFG